MKNVFRVFLSISIMIFLLAGCSSKKVNQPSGDITNGAASDITGTAPHSTVTVTPTNEAPTAAAAGEEGGSDMLPIKYDPITYHDKIVNNGNFIKGVDISSVLALEAAGVKYYNGAGEEEDIFKILKDAGVNYVRVRVWNDPYLSTAKDKTPENSYGGGICDVKHAAEIGKRCAAVGMSLYVDFHYSDFWSDPGRSYAPKAWVGMDLTEKAKALYDFTTESLKTIKASGVNIGIVGIGNETNNFMAGEAGIKNIAVLMKSGAEAVRAYDPDILIAVHFTNPESHDYVTSFASVLDTTGVDYDIFASSYYPFWHGTIENMQRRLDAVADKYGKLTMIAEYSYYNSGDADAKVAETFGTADEKGQANAIIVINKAASEVKNCIGTFYWEPAWIDADPKYWATQGTGWITKNATEYDLANANVTEAQGSACTDQTLFAADGHPLYSITSAVFNRIWTDK